MWNISGRCRYMLHYFPIFGIHVLTHTIVISFQIMMLQLFANLLPRVLSKDSCWWYCINLLSVSFALKQAFNFWFFFEKLPIPSSTKNCWKHVLSIIKKKIANYFPLSNEYMHLFKLSHSFAHWREWKWSSQNHELLNQGN